MKVINASLLLFLALAVPAYSQFTRTALVNNTEDIQEIKRSMQTIERAFVSRDPAPFEKLYIDGYVGIRGKTVYNAREQLAAMVRWDAAALKSGKKLDFETLSYESDLPTIHVFGDSAIVTVLKKNLWRYKESKCLSQYQSTELWLKLDSQWKVAVGHMSTIQCDPMPWQPPHPAVTEVRNQTKPTKYLSPTVETELRELISKLNEAGFSNETTTDAFSPDFESTGLNYDVSSDRNLLLGALRTPAGRGGERYRDDEAFLNYGNTAAYFFRVRSISKAGETKPEPPVNYSVIFIKQDSGWKIVSSHASSLQD